MASAPRLADGSGSVARRTRSFDQPESARFRRPDPLLSLGLSVVAAVAATLLLPYL